MKGHAILSATVFFSTTLLANMAPCAQTRRPDRPNILFIIADDMSWPHVGAYGDRVVKTPSIDGLARQGVLFNYAYSASASCTISRNAILTGQQPWRLEEGSVFGGTLPRKFDVFPLLLEKARSALARSGRCHVFILSFAADRSRDRDLALTWNL